jgi:transposase
MRDIARVLEDIRGDLMRARQRLTKFLLRHGYVFNEVNARGQRISNWTNAHWEWIRKIKFPQMADEEALAFYISEVRHFEKHKKQIERFISDHAKRERWASRVEALRCIQGIETVTAFTLVVEAQVFTRFDTASAYASWLGLTPSEHSSGESERHGGITKAGNSYVRKLLIETSWHYTRALGQRKKGINDAIVPLSIQNHAAKAIKRLCERRRHLHAKGKKPVVANCATARELACWVWAIGRMCEGSL